MIDQQVSAAGYCSVAALISRSKGALTVASTSLSTAEMLPGVLISRSFFVAEAIGQIYALCRVRSSCSKRWLRLG